MLLDVLKLVNEMSKKEKEETVAIYNNAISKMFSEIFFLDLTQTDSSFSSNFSGDGTITPNANWVPNELKSRYSDFDRQNIKLLEFLMFLYVQMENYMMWSHFMK